MGMGVEGWIVSALAVLLTGISKSGLGGILGGFAVPFMAVWMSPREAAGVMLPVLIAIDFFGIRAWVKQASWHDLKILIPGAVVGIVLGTLAFGVLSDNMVRVAVGAIAVGFAADRLFRHTHKPRPMAAGTGKWMGWLLGAGAGFTSTLAHTGGPPLMIYLIGRQMPREKLVATSVIFFAIINLAKLPTFIELNLITRDTLLVSAALLPMVPLGVWSGINLLAKIPERVFFALAIAGLGLSGLKLLWDGLVV